VAEETTCGFFDAAADAERWQVESKRGRQEQLEELTLLQTRGSELCFAIVGPPQARNHLSEGMQITALWHTEMARELAMLQTAVSSALEFMLGRLPDKTIQVEVVNEMVAEIYKLEERRSRPKCPGVRICDLLLVPSFGRA
jgi:hypothetical protein